MITSVKGIEGLWSYHLPAQRPTDGIAVYFYDRVDMWSCEVDGAWQMTIALVKKED